MKNILPVLFIVLIFTNAEAQPAEYTAKVKQMLTITGARQTFSSAVDQMIGQMKQLRTDVSDDTWTELQTEFKKTSIDDLVELLSPIYFKYLDESDITGIIAFYETSVGRKYAENTPAITQESMIAGQEWGMKIGQEIANRLTDKGY